jgi:hypothetical protein
MRTRQTTQLALCALAALSLAACQKKDEAPPAPAAEVAAPAADAAAADTAYATAAPAADAAVAEGEAPPAPTTRAPVLPRPRPAEAQPIRPDVSAPQLAYAYQYALAAPSKAVRKLVNKHEQVCWAAGPSVCQVVGSNISEDGKDQVSAKLTIRAQPAWLRTFRAGLDDDTKAVGGRTITADTSSDDWSRTIVDSEAQLRSQIILRDRLEAALKSRKAKVSELFEMEQQLAQVRGQIDTARSEVAMMKGRVAMSTLTIDYRSKGVLAPDGSFAPLGDAASDVVGIFVGVLAFLIRAAAVLAAPVGLGALIWVVGQRRRKAAVKAPTA